MLKFIEKIFADGRALEDEMHSMSAVTLIMATLEHLGDDMAGIIPVVTAFYVHEMRAEGGAEA